MPRTLLTLGRRFGLIYLILVGSLALTCTLVVLNMRAMHTDSRRLLEENREARIASELVAEIELLGVLFGLRAHPQVTADQVDPCAREHLAEAKRLVREALRSDPIDDPSRDQHQAAEQRLGATVEAALGELTAELARNAQQPSAMPIGPRIEQALRYARVLETETVNEAALAHRDLAELVKRSTWAIWSAVGFTAAVLALTLVHVLRRVVRPLLTLRQGADQLGAGALAHRIPVQTRDEIGAVARSFNEMAERLGNARRDLEERMRARTHQFVAASRLADLGSFAASIAHEINNPLGSIASCAEGLERRLLSGSVPEAEQRDYLQTIAKEAWRARDITGRLLTLARQDRQAPAPVDPQVVCKQLELIVRHRFETAGVALVIEPPSQSSPLFGNANEITQMLVNLLLNALDASTRGAHVWLRCRADGARVHFEVEDEGPGISEVDVTRVFQPFYTTKAPGKGTGLGLTLVAAIVEGHGGTLDVRRGARGGALFEIALPAGAEATP